jgi:tetratricopeptide (TPR) repeat protein
MPTLIDLSKKLKVHAGVLKERLEEAGLTDVRIDQELEPEVAQFLKDVFHVPLAKRFARLFSPIRRLFSESEPLPDPELAIPPLSIAPEDPLEIEPVSLEESLQAIAEWKTLHEGVTPESETAPPPLAFLSEPEETEAEPETFMTTDAAPGAGTHPPEAMPSEAPVRGVVEPPAEDSDPSLLLASLETLELMRAALKAEEEEAEYEEAIALAAEKELAGLPALKPETVPKAHLREVPEEMSSQALQALVDELTKGVKAPEEALAEVKQGLAGQVAGTLGKLVPRLDLSPRDKAIIVAALALAAAIVGLALSSRQTNYGPGGDGRFYREGVASQQKKDYKGALASFDKVLQRYPDSPLLPHTFQRVGEIQEERGDLTASGRALQQALWYQDKILGSATSTWPQGDLRDRWDIQFKLGEIYQEKKDWATAADWFSRVLREAAVPSLAQHSMYRLSDSLYQNSASETRETDELRNLIKLHERALDASPECVDSGPALFRMARMWEELAGLELGVRTENLEKALGFLNRLRDQHDRTGDGGHKQLDIELEIARLERALGKIEESLSLLRSLLASPVHREEEGAPPFKISFSLGWSLLKRAEASIDAGRGVSPEIDLHEVLEISRNREDHPFSEEELTEALYLRGHANYFLGILRATKEGEGSNPYYEKMDAAYTSALARNDLFGPGGEDSLLAMMRRTNYAFQISHNYQEAGRSYRKILDHFPNSVYSYRTRFRLGTALFQLGDYAGAEEQFQQVVGQFDKMHYTDDAAFRESYFRLGHCQFLRKEYSRAANTIKTLLQLLDYEETPDTLAAWRLLAEAYYSQGLYDQAIEELRSYLTRYPNQDPDGKLRLALGRDLIARFDYEEGRAELKRVVEEYPQSEISRWSRYLVCDSYLGEAKAVSEKARQELLKKALADAERIRVDYPSEDYPLYLLGRIHFELADYDRATRDLEYYLNAARGQKPPDFAQLLLGESYFRLKRYKQAIPLFQKVEGSADLSREELARALFLLGESLRFDERFGEAGDVYDKLVKLYPASPFSELAPGRAEEVRWRAKKGI